jgi:nucleoside-diphosphate-sugar epimerase
MAVLIIGAGLVGSQIGRILVEQGERPVLFDYAPQPDALGEIVDLGKVELVQGDVMRPFSLSQAILDHGIREIIHTAANPNLTLGAQTDPSAAIQLNIMGTVNVLEAARIHKLGRIVVASSNVLNYFLTGGEGEGDPLKEEAFMRPTTFYAATKQAIESIGLNYARWSGVDFTAVRYGAVFGPWGGAGGGGPSKVVLSAVRQVLAGEEAALPSGGMEWVYSKDAAIGTVKALQATQLKSRVFNVTMGAVSQPEDMRDALKAAMPGARVRIEAPSAAMSVLPDMKRPSDLSLAKEVLGYAPSFDLQASVRDLAAHVAANAKA